MLQDVHKELLEIKPSGEKKIKKNPWRTLKKKKNSLMPLGSKYRLTETNDIKASESPRTDALSGMFHQRETINVLHPDRRFGDIHSFHTQ